MEGCSSSSSNLAAMAAASANVAVNIDPASVYRILICDDDPIASCSLEEMIYQIELSQQELGVKISLSIHTVDSGKEACIELSRTRFDLVILDIGLPDITGFDVARWYLQRTADEYSSASESGAYINRSPATLVALTALTLNNAIEAELKDTFSEVLAKPMSIMTLRGMLQRWLPRAVTDGAKANKQASEVEQSRLVRVLQVEDCDLASMAIEHLFKSVGCWVETVRDGESAMAKLTHSHSESQSVYDLVLLDVNLPTVSGYALSSWYAQMCRQHALRRAPVIAVTAEPDFNACREFGVDRCLPKPVTIEMVRELMSQWRALHG